ncbi:MAG: rRNA maturation RNase YbeY [Chloroflexota bacterium]|nr:rRNA maturation RNase YbeY [Chloroflexota bacterium]
MPSRAPEPERHINLQALVPVPEGISLEILERLAEYVLAREVQAQACLSLVLAPDQIVMELNQRYLGRNEPTDVLAFPAGPLLGAPPDLPEENYLGDVLISLPQAERQAPDYGFSTQEELELLTIHGILHLVGYDEQEEATREVMWRRQEELLKGFRTHPSAEKMG